VVEDDRGLHLLATYVRHHQAKDCDVFDRDAAKAPWPLVDEDVP